MQAARSSDVRVSRDGSVTEARDFAIIMAYDAFRICIGRPPKNKPADVLRWMRLMLRASEPTEGESK